MKLKIPNILTIGRIIIVPIFVVTFFIPGFFGDLIPFFLFVLASFTDYLDGLLARLFKEESKLGEILAIFPSQKFLIKCSGGVIIVHESSPIKLRIGSVLDQKETPFKNFKRNEYGFFDL